MSLLDLAALDDGQLSDRGMRRLAAHVATCATCLAVFDSLIEDAQGAIGTGMHRVNTWPAPPPAG